MRFDEILDLTQQLHPVGVIFYCIEKKGSSFFTTQLVVECPSKSESIPRACQSDIFGQISQTVSREQRAPGWRTALLGDVDGTTLGGNACYDRGTSTFRLILFPSDPKSSEMGISSDPKSSEMGIFFFCHDSRCVPRPAWDFYRGWRFYFFSKSVFERGS